MTCRPSADIRYTRSSLSNDGSGWQHANLTTDAQGLTSATLATDEVTIDFTG